MLADGQDALDDEATIRVNRDRLAQHLNDRARWHVAPRHGDRPAIHPDVAEGGVVIAEAGGRRPLIRGRRLERGPAHQRQRSGFVEAALGIIDTQHIGEVVETFRGGRLRHRPAGNVAHTHLHHGNRRGRCVPAGGKDTDFLPRDVGRVIAGRQELHLLAHREGTARGAGGGIEERLCIEAVVFHLDVGGPQRLVGLAVGVRRTGGSGHMLTVDADREQFVSRVLGLRQRRAAEQCQRQDGGDAGRPHGAAPDTSRVSIGRS